MNIMVNKELKFQELLGKFKGDLVFRKVVEKKLITEDEILYKIETSDGVYYVLEMDYFDTFNYVENFLQISGRGKNSHREI